MSTHPSSKSSPPATDSAPAPLSPDQVDLCSRITEVTNVLLDVKAKLLSATDQGDKEYKALIFDFMGNLVRIQPAIAV
jgi:hypothetical protein